MQPIYSESSYKIEARKMNVDIYRRLTGRHSIPEGRGYWTLCNYQGREPGSEIVQMCEAGLLGKKQFHGVDRDEDIILKNKECHAEANWYTGDWTEVTGDAENFNPSLIYLDTTCFADHWVAADILSKTMMICQTDTVLLANVMLNDPRSRKQFDADQLIKNIVRLVPALELGKWSPTVENFTYSTTGRTFFKTYALYKP